MKKTIVAISIISFALVALGCQNTKTKAVEGAVVGSVLGAGTGGIIGHQTHHGAQGAGIGAAVGAIAGGIIGSQIEKKDEVAKTKEASLEANPNQMSVLQVIELSKQGTPDDIIIDKIKKTNSKFNLSAEDINYLKKQGLSQKVINAMQAN